MNDNGSIIRSELIKCPFCFDILGVDDKQALEIACRCGGSYSVEYDDEQDLYIMTKILK